MIALATPFRAFFLLAGTTAALWIPAWVVIFTRGVPMSTNLAPLGWHAHEMVFGYTGAVLAGFLLTAARNWTKRETLRGGLLALLVALWISGRITALLGQHLPAPLPLVFDGGFFALLAYGIARPIIAARSRRNYAFPVLVLVLGACDLLVHLHAAGRAPMWTARALDAAVDSIVIILVLFAGRVVPMFTGNAIDKRVRAKGLLDHGGLALVLAYAIAHAALPEHAIASALAAAAGVVGAVRLYGWGGSQTLRKPLLWILHAGWLLLSAGLALRGLGGLAHWPAPSAWTHLITVGGIGVLSLGMMSRVALGHTGRRLVAPSIMASGYWLLVLATVTRVAASLLGPAYYRPLLWVAAAAWALAFAIFAARYAPILLSPRADGKPG